MSNAVIAPERVEACFRAMGTEVHIVVTGGTEDHLALARARIEELEARWSRFRDSSEISQLNRSAGRPVVLSPDSWLLLERSLRAWQDTEGRFDPSVGEAIRACGYDRDFAELVAPVVPAATGATPGLGGIELVPAVRAVTLPPGLSLDAGGIGKGLAADLTAEWLLDLGAAGALVNLGGDLRAVGRAPDDAGWTITVPDPLEPDAELLRLALPAGAVATSSSLLRRWRTTTGEAHHLIDPRRGEPAITDVVAVTVVSSHAWWAEALTKSLYLAGPDALDGLRDAHAVMVMADGTRHCTPGLEETLR